MYPEQTHELKVHPGFEQDMQRLNRDAGSNHNSREQRLLMASLAIVKSLRTGRPSTHPLVFMPSYPDLSDCQTSYVGIDLDEKPSHRIVWRELPPATPRGLPIREVIAFGERDLGAAYHIAGTRLGRPRGITLYELENEPEPIATPEQARAIMAERRRRYPELFHNQEKNHDTGANPSADHRAPEL